MSDLIVPRTLSGFRDYLPASMLAREEILQRVRQVYRSYGYTPIDTPACEALDILLGKGGDESDKLIYRVRSARSDKEEMGLRFDLTVPFARFAAQYVTQLGLPFKRYAMGPVWRGERPGHGRYREFWQCDFDIIGTTSNAADIEVALVIHDLLVSLGFDRFVIRINNRLLLNGLLARLGLLERAVPLLRALDKLPKIGREKVAAEMVQLAQITPEQAEQVLQLTQLQDRNSALLDRVEAFFADQPHPLASEGIQRLRELLSVLGAIGIPEQRLAIDLSICRGLDYYTGTVYETFLDDLPAIGSVCSGGRYDNLAGKYTRQVLPGVGASLGLDRLLAAMEHLGHPLLQQRLTPADVLIVQFDAQHLADYHRLARQLRQAGITVEVYPEARKIGQQLAYAEKRGFRWAVIAGSEEFAQGLWKVKNLSRREEIAVPDAEVVATLQALLQRTVSAEAS
ncbi:MAG: histidine--tRNA ligase [Gemmataceae bacterium]|nr:histidine--tRNA ligase [Gemmataceae bacterium]MCS7270637.1 histidine--tRNA ligase [Gemmataceae bacterium]MDW8244184.1 histidine--tRNA ligase [Thermogemmata sp.]